MPRANSRTHWVTSRAFGGIDLLDAHFVDQTFAPHVHDGFAIALVEHGATSFWCRGASHRAYAGELIVIPPGEVHTGGPFGAEGWHYRVAYPSASLMRACAGAISTNGAPPLFDQIVIRDAECAKLFRHAHVALLDRGDDELGAPLFEQALAELLSRHAHSVGDVVEPRRLSPAVQAVRAHLDVHFASGVRLDELARLARLSPYHLTRVFKEQIGMSPFGYLMDCRVNRARALLREGRPAHQVAYLTGFADQSHLTRNFKRIVGVTPASFAKGARTRALARTPALGDWCASTPDGIVAAPEPVPRIA
jgi:AraC-like DNA-binding protein